MTGVGLLRRVLERMGAVGADDDPAPFGAELPVRAGTTLIADTLDRQQATVQGRVGALTVPTAGSVPTLVLNLADASGAMDLVFVGRRTIPGIETGVALRASGRVSIDTHRRVMYNPAYEIVPRDDR